jgi:hypothetical protein
MQNVIVGIAIVLVTLLMGGCALVDLFRFPRDPER